MFLKGPRYKATEGFKASKTVLAWVGCRSCVTRHKEAYRGIRLERGVIKQAQGGQTGKRRHKTRGNYRA